MDVAAIIRRVRRVQDLSQRELAARLDVSHATIGRWESGCTAIRVDQLERLLALADMRLAVVDADDEPVEGYGDETSARDAAGRHQPAHLDARAFHAWDMGVVERVGAPRRSRRFDPPRREERVRDRPLTVHEVVVARERYAAPILARQEARVRAARERAARRVALGLVPPECSCLVECEEVWGCVPDCSCRCEASD